MGKRRVAQKRGPNQTLSDSAAGVRAREDLHRIQLVAARGLASGLVHGGPPITQERLDSVVLLIRKAERESGKQQVSEVLPNVPYDIEAGAWGSWKGGWTYVFAPAR